MNPNYLRKLKEEADKLHEEIEKSWKNDYTVFLWCAIFALAVAAVGILAFIGGVIK